jgi:hypothetical protein
MNVMRPGSSEGALVEVRVPDALVVLEREAQPEQEAGKVWARKAMTEGNQRPRSPSNGFGRRRSPRARRLPGGLEHGQVGGLRLGSVKDGYLGQRMFQQRWLQPMDDGLSQKPSTPRWTHSLGVEADQHRMSCGDPPGGEHWLGPGSVMHLELRAAQNSYSRLTSKRPRAFQAQGRP